MTGRERRAGPRRWPIAVPAVAVLLAGCTNPGQRDVAGVRQASAAEVAQCRYVADFRARPGVYGVLADQGVQLAVRQIKIDAREAGADTVVFDPVAPDTLVTSLHAVAYDCGS